MFAFHLAETISTLFRHVLDHPSKVLYDPETEPLFLPLFWFYPIYREMLNSASRHRPSKSMELRRAASGLVKVICRTEESRPGGKGLKPGKPKKKGLELPSGLIRNLFRLACFVNSSLRFLILNLHPICTCSC